MKSIFNFITGGLSTYCFIFLSTDINSIPPDVWELIKLLLSGIFGILTTIILNYLKRKWDIDDKNIKDRAFKEGVDVNIKKNKEKK